MNRLLCWFAEPIFIVFALILDLSPNSMVPDIKAIVSVLISVFLLRVNVPASIFNAFILFTLFAFNNHVPKPCLFTVPCWLDNEPEASKVFLSAISKFKIPCAPNCMPDKSVPN